MHDPSEILKILKYNFIALKRAYGIEETSHMLPSIPFATIKLLEFGHLIFWGETYAATLAW